LRLAARLVDDSERRLGFSLVDYSAEGQGPGGVARLRLGDRAEHASYTLNQLF
jgi:hypothetical protein